MSDTDVTRRLSVYDVRARSVDISSFGSVESRFVRGDSEVVLRSDFLPEIEVRFRTPVSDWDIGDLVDVTLKRVRHDLEQ